MNYRMICDDGESHNADDSCFIVQTTLGSVNMGHAVKFRSLNYVKYLRKLLDFHSVY